jgi:glycosyltransferase involved in cell wall biosynthesis
MKAPAAWPAAPPRVLLVAESLRPGGLSQYAVSLKRGLAAAGLPARLIAPERPAPGWFAPAEEAGVRAFPGLLGGFFRPFVLHRLAAWAREEHFSLVHGLSAFTAPVCHRLAAALRTPFVLSVHHYQERGDLRADARCLAVLACSESIRENLVNDARLPKELIHVVPLGIEIPADLPPPPEAAGRAPLVATFAQLTPKQDVATFVQAAAAIARQAPGGSQFLIVGEGPEESRLRKLASQLQVHKQIIFSHAGVPLERILPEISVYVQTARREGFGLAVLQAMAWGRPVVATAVGGLIGLVRDGQTGFLVPAGDAAAVAARTVDLLGDPARRATMAQNGRALAVKEFSLARMIERTVRVYAGAARDTVSPCP